MKKIALLLSILTLASCGLNDSQSLDKNSTIWSGLYQGILNQEGNEKMVEVHLDSTLGLSLTTISLKNFESKLLKSDSIFWNTNGTGISIEGSEDAIVLGNNKLTLVSGDKRIKLQKVDPSNSIEAQNWILEELNQVKLRTQGKPIRILLNSTIQKLSGYDGCNYLNAAYQVYYPEKRIYFSPIASTRRACLETDSLARAFLNALNDFENYEIQDRQLALLKDGKVIARFKMVSYGSEPEQTLFHRKAKALKQRSTSS